MHSAASFSAFAVAFELAVMIEKNISPGKGKRLIKYAAFLAVTTTVSLNCYIVRAPESDIVVTLLDREGKNALLEGETSKYAAKRGARR
jgi:hypothetical protein